MREVQDSKYIKEDEIDLRELFKTIKKHIIKIIIFVFLVVCMTLIYLIITPNVYESKVTLFPQSESTKSLDGGLSSLASLAGVNLDSKSSFIDPYVMIKNTLSDYDFNSLLIKKYDLYEKINNQQNLVYPFDLNFENKKEEEELTEDEKIFRTMEKLEDILSVSQDKKTDLITLSATLEDRFFAKELVDIYLENIIQYIKKNDSKDLNKQIEFYKTELQSTKDIILKEQLSKSLSELLQKKVFSQANEYYFVSKLTNSRVSYIKQKIKPKRSLILIVSFITSFILAIFMVFFLEFIRNEK